MSAAVSMPDGKVHLDVISTTEVSTFRGCVREWYFAYVLMRRPRRKSEALRFGSLFGRGLDAWWGCESSDPADRFVAAVDAMRKLADEKPEETDQFELVKAEELMLGYTARWGNEPYDTLAIELPFETPITNPATGATSRTFRMGGKIDKVIRDRRTGKKRGVEHKTTSNDIGAGSDYWRQVSATDGQVSTYFPGARASGHDIEDFLYDVVRKVALRPKLATPVESRRYTKKGFLDARQRETDETPEEFRNRVRADIEENPEKYYARNPIVRLERDEAEHANDVWMTTWFMREAKKANRYPRSTNACRRFQTFCNYFEVCSGQASIDDDNRFRTASTPHEGLAEV